MNIRQNPLKSFAEAQAKFARKPDFICECGEEWMTPGHQWWVGKMRCTSCGEVVEAK